MNQLVLPINSLGQSLQVNIDRDGPVLRIPEGLKTIPCTHGIHRFPGKFIPNLPRYFLREILDPRERRRVCDPFCGSGTTLVEAALERREYLGFDVDRLSVLISSAKVNALSDDELVALEDHWRKCDYEARDPTAVPDIPNLKHWFSETCIRQLSGIKRHCLALNGRLRDFSLIVFSSIVRRVSNADDQTQKTYVSHTLPKKPPEPKDLFPVFLKKALEGMKEYKSLLDIAPRGEVKTGDARFLCPLPDTDIITSPPYIDSVDYVYNQMLEYFWLLPELGLGNIAAYRSFRKTPMGFRDQFAYSTTWLGRLSLKLRKHFSESHRIVESVSRKEAANLATFFCDFAQHAESAAEALQRNSRYICVIGESVIRGVSIPTVDLTCELLRSAGFTLKDRMQYEIRRHYMKFPRRGNSGKIKQDYILVFQR